MNWTRKWINPVLEKEFRLRMRSLRAPLALMFYLLAIGMLAMGFIYLNMRGGAGTINPERSRELFYFLSGAQLVLISFMTPGLTAGVVSGEREKQTLNILLTTQQSSTTIILSKLFASLSFMFLIVFATLPLYSIVFLYGGISPAQLVSVFLFYVFVMILLGSMGIFFSTLFKKSTVSVITAYGFAFFCYGFTALGGLFLMALLRRTSDLATFLMSLNPMVAMFSIWEPGLRSMFGGHLKIPQWLIFVGFYTVVSVLAIALSIRYLRPVLRPARRPAVPQNRPDER